MQKYDYSKQCYFPYSVPDTWYTPLKPELDEAINCASCGDLLIAGNGFTSTEIHNHIGLGYIVCDDCHDGELTRKHLVLPKRKKKV